MRKFLFAAPLLLLGAAFLSPAPVMAQGATQATVVATCGTPPSTYVAGTNRNITQDTTGTTCTAGGGGGGSTNATIVAPLGTQTTAASVAVTQGNGQDVVEGTTTDAAGCSTSGGAHTINGCLPQLHADATAGVAAPGATYPASAVATGCRAATAQPTAVTDGQLVAPQCGTGGQQVVVIGSAASFKVRGHTTGTDNAAHTIIGAGSGSLKNYVTGVQCSRNDAGTSPITLTFSDDASSTMLLPNAGNGGGNNFILDASPLATAAATAFTFTASTGTTTVACNAQGYQAP